MNLGISFGHGLLPTEVVKGAKIAEESGYESVWVSESTAFDSLSILAAVAYQTKNIRLASGIVNVYSRSPAQLAMGAVTLDELSSGRFTLGLGASSKSVVSSWHNLEYKNQLSKVRACVEEIREKTQPLRNSFLQASDHNRPIRIILAAVQERMILLAKEISDGLLFFLRPFSVLKMDAERLASSNFSVSASVVTCVSNDSNVAKNRVRRTVAFYVTYGGSYRRFLVLSGALSEETANKIRSLWLSGRREDAAKLLPNETLDQVSVYGTPLESRRRIEEYASLPGLIDLVLQFNAGEKELADSFRILTRLRGV